MGAAFLLGVEIGGHIFHERRRQQRLHVDEPQVAVRELDELQRLGEPFGALGVVGEIDREQYAMKHVRSPLADADARGVRKPRFSHGY